MTNEGAASLEEEPRQYRRRRRDLHSDPAMHEADATKMVSTVSVVGGLMVAASGFLPRDVFSVVTVVFVLAFSFGWEKYLNKMIGVSTVLNSLVVAFSGLLALFMIRFFHDVGYLVLVIAASILLAFIADMLRPDPRDESLRLISGTVAGSFVTIISACWVGLCDNRIWHEAAIPTGVLIAAVAFAGIFIRSRRIYSAVIVIMGIMFGAVIAFTLDLFVNIQQRGIILFPSLPGSPTHQNIVVIVSCIIFGIFVALVLIFSTLFVYFTRRVLVLSEQLALGLMPVMMCGLPLYVFVRIVGS